MRIFVLEDDFSQQTRIETTIEKLLKEHHITPSSFEVFGKPAQLLAEVHEKGAHQQGLRHQLGLPQTIQAPARQAQPSNNNGYAV